jgi:acyl carrier protein
LVKLSNEPVGGALLEKLREELKNGVAGILKMDVNNITTDENFSAYGFDSISLTEYVNKINARYITDVNPTIFFEYNNIDLLSRYLISAYSEQIAKFYGKKLQPKAAEEKTSNMLPTSVVSLNTPDKITQSSNLRGPEDIAIIGMSGMFPGAESLKEFWSNLENKKQAISSVSTQRWDSSNFPDAINLGGFIENADKFDAEFFNISPREAELMDPQQRLFLQAVYIAFEDSGYRVPDLRGNKVGVFVGMEHSDYAELLSAAKVVDGHVATGLAHSIIANRISYLFDFRGPSESIDTACSSSLVALHRAVKSLQLGESELAVAGGVSILLTPSTFMQAGKAGMLSPDGACKSFDKEANGYVRGLSLIHI